MRRILLFLLLFSGLTQFVTAQEDAAVWQTYKVAGGAVFAEFPTVPRVSVAKAETDKQSSLSKAYFNKTFYFVWSCPSTNCDVFEVVRKLKFRARNSAAAKFSETKSGKDVIEAVFADSEGFHHRIRQFENQAKHLIVHTISETAENAEVSRFLDSVTTTKPDGDVSEPDTETFEKRLADSTEAVELSPKSRPKDGVAEKPDASQLPSVSVSFSSKPRAVYTDAARIYEITGDVVVRATFLASGSVTNIEPIKRLPFGLTEQAIAAAEKIRFNPGMKDGKPVTVTRPVSYSFFIY